MIVVWRTLPWSESFHFFGCSHQKPQHESLMGQVYTSKLGHFGALVKEKQGETGKQGQSKVIDTQEMFILIFIINHEINKRFWQKTYLGRFRNFKSTWFRFISLYFYFLFCIVFLTLLYF